MPCEVALEKSRGTYHARVRAVSRLWPSASLALTVTMVYFVAGCSNAERKFDDVNGGDSGADTDSSGNGPSSSDASSGSSVDPSSTARGDAGAACSAVTCPKDTECRTYVAVNCEQGETAECDVTDVDEGTPCDSNRGTCDGQGECVVPDRAGLGTPCERDDECGSHHCAPSATGARVCCDTACGDPCTVCSADGHCDATPANDDACGALSCPTSTTCASYPTDTSAANCKAFGRCDTAETYCTPDFESADVPCGDGRVCDGAGACIVDCPSPGPERACTRECPCETGEGTCESNDQCAEGFVCTRDAIAKLGFPSASCLPSHCVNDRKDADETSVDCGGGCGCRATYEVVEISGLPADAGFHSLTAMSGDGKHFSAIIGRDGDLFVPTFPARVDARGVVTELEGFGTWGSALGINADGTIIVGALWCDNQPDCTATAHYLPVQWTNGEPPVNVFWNGTADAVSAGGAIVAGMQTHQTLGVDMAYRASANGYVDIPELNSVVAMSADGEYVVGRSSTADVGALWSTTLQGLVELHPPSEWQSWGIEALSGDGHVFAGTAYIGPNTDKPAFVWRDGLFYEFPKLAGASYNHFGAISADGSVIVGMSGTNSVQRAFIWDETNGIRTVLAETVARGLELPVDLELREVDFLSADGTILVGWMYGAATPSFWRVVLLP